MLEILQLFLSFYTNKKGKKNVKIVKHALYFHAKVTPLILIFGAIVVTTQGILGKPIICGTNDKTLASSTITTICLNDRNIFTFKERLVSDPELGESMELVDRISFSNIRFTGLGFLFAAILYLCPYVFWKIKSERLIEHMFQYIEESNLKEDEKKNFYIHTVTALMSIRKPEKYLKKYMKTLQLNVLANCGYLLVAYLMYFKLNIFWYAFEYVAYQIGIVSEDPTNFLFPRQASCVFETFGVSGSIQKTDAVCFLLLNSFLDKFYLLFTFWLVFVAILNLCSFIAHFRMFTNRNHACMGIIIPPGHRFILSLLKMNLKRSEYQKVCLEYHKRFQNV